MKLTLMAFLLALGTVSAIAQEAGTDKNVKYVRVDSSSDDAVVQDGTDFLESNPLCRLIQNQTVTLLGEKDGEYVKIRVTCDGETVEGWVKKRILVDKPFNPPPRVTESGGAETAAMGGQGSVGHGIPEPPKGERENREAEDPP